MRWVVASLGLLGVAACGSDKKAEGPPRDDIIYIAEATNGGRFGEWTEPVYCPAGSYAVGFRARVEASQGARDDTGLNSVELICHDTNGVHAGTIVPHPGIYGEWGIFERASAHTWLTGFRLTVEYTDQDESVEDFDDTAADSVGFYETPVAGGRARYVEAYNGILAWADPGPPVFCPPHSAICGLTLKVEALQGKGGGSNDDTAMNDMRVACCALPDQRWDCHWDACGFACTDRALDVRGSQCPYLDTAEPTRCGQPDEPSGTPPDIDSACEIVLGREGGETRLATSPRPDEVIPFPTIEDVAWDTVKATRGPCHFQLYRGRDFDLDTVTFGSGVNSPVPIGPDAFTGGEDTWTVRSLRIVGARVDRVSDCRLSLADQHGGFDLFGPTRDLPRLRFLDAVEGDGCRFTLEPRGTEVWSGLNTRLAMDRPPEWVELDVADRIVSTRRCEAGDFDVCAEDTRNAQDDLCGCACLAPRGDECPVEGESARYLFEDPAACKRENPTCEAGERYVEDRVCGCYCAR